MAFATVNFKAEALGKQSAVQVIVPEAAPGPFPVLYLLHGLSDNHTTWNLRVPVEAMVGDRPLMVVMPDGGRSFYCNNPAPGGGQYEDYIAEDLIGFIDRTFPTIAGREGRALAGNSMGGYGAAMLAMRHAEMFCAAVSHSGAMYFAHEGRPIEHDYVSALVGALSSDGYDLFKLAERRRPTGERPALRIDCGTDDFLLESNRDFHRHLDALGIAHEYAEHGGGHDWDYWREHLPETIEFVMRHVATS